MKKSLLALAVAALATASTVSATTVYDKDGTTLGFHGRVQSVLYSGKQAGVTDEKASINTSGRLGVDLRTQITPGVAAFAMAEWELANGNNSYNEASGFQDRLMWVGLDFGKAGSVKFGKFEEAIKYSLFATDVFDDYGGLGYSGNDDRRAGTVMYQWSGNGVDALVSYAFAKDQTHLDGAYESAGDKNEYVNLEYSVSAAIGYTSPDVVFGPIAVRAGFATGSMNNPEASKQKNSFNTIKNPERYNFDNEVVSGGRYDSYTSYALGVSWGKTSIGPYIGAQFSQRKLDANDFTVTSGNTSEVVSLDAKVTGYEFVLGYAFPNGVQVRTGYQTQKYENFGGETAKAATVPVYANWNLNSQVQVWAEARFDAGTDDKDNGKNFADHTMNAYGNLGDNVFSAGIRYNF